MAANLDTISSGLDFLHLLCRRKHETHRFEARCVRRVIPASDMHYPTFWTRLPGDDMKAI